MDYNGLTLAYIGDATYEVLVREYLLRKGITKVDSLHKEAIKYTSAEGQERAFNIIESSLTDKEIAIFKRGRNSKTDRKARNASVASYKKATGFEALMGYLYLQKDTERINELFIKVIDGFENA